MFSTQRPKAVLLRSEALVSVGSVRNGQQHAGRLNTWIVLLAGALTCAVLAGPVAAAESDIGFIGLHGGIYEQLEKHAPALYKFAMRYFDDNEIATRKADLNSVGVYSTRSTWREKTAPAYADLIKQAKQKKKVLHIVAFMPNSADFPPSHWRERTVGRRQVKHPSKSTVRPVRTSAGC